MVCLCPCPFLCLAVSCLLFAAVVAASAGFAFEVRPAADVDGYFGQLAASLFVAAVAVAVVSADSVFAVRLAAAVDDWLGQLAVYLFVAAVAAARRADDPDFVVERLPAAVHSGDSDSRVADCLR